MSNNLSFFNDPALKAQHVEQAKRHYELDMLVAGTFGRTGGDVFKGCSVGCFAHEIKPNFKSEAANPHQIIAEHLNLPQWLILLQDTIFEGLPSEDRKIWHVQFAEAIPVGKDLEPVRHLLAIRRMNRLITLLNKESAVKTIDKQVIAALILVKSCHEAELNKNTCDWQITESVANSAAESVRTAETWFAQSNTWTAKFAARSARWSTKSATNSAANSAAEFVWSARAAADPAEPVVGGSYRQERDDLLEILKHL